MIALFYQRKLASNWFSQLVYPFYYTVSNIQSSSTKSYSKTAIRDFPLVGFGVFHKTELPLRVTKSLKALEENICQSIVNLIAQLR